MIPLKYYLDPKASEAGIVFESPKDGDAGYDLRSITSSLVEGESQTIISTGLYIAIPHGWVGIVKDRSSMASKGIRTHGGVIDSSYRGEVKIILSNSKTDAYYIEAGAKVAQLIVVPHSFGAVSVGSIEDLGRTTRGEKGFGSSGM